MADHGSLPTLPAERKTRQHLLTQQQDKSLGGTQHRRLARGSTPPYARAAPPNSRPGVSLLLQEEGWKSWERAGQSSAPGAAQDPPHCCWIRVRSLDGEGWGGQGKQAVSWLSFAGKSKEHLCSKTHKTCNSGPGRKVSLHYNNLTCYIYSRFRHPAARVSQRLPERQGETKLPEGGRQESAKLPQPPKTPKKQLPLSATSPLRHPRFAWAKLARASKPIRTAMQWVRR